MAPFAGYDMPISYPLGVLKEHLHTRAAAGMFDVSHMGQARLRGPGAVAAIEALVPGDIAGLAPGRIRYTQLTDDTGGILDDLMVARDPSGVEDSLLLVVNAACKAADFAHIAAHLPAGVTLEPFGEWGLIALQGPHAAAVLARLADPSILTRPFMSVVEVAVDGYPCLVSRSGYTGEDGFEISVAPERAEALARTLLAQPEVEAIGLGARDSLRLEAGLPLYGHDIDTTTSPVEAGLTWSVGKRRREDGGFAGAERILAEIAEGASRKRVGIRPDGRQPVREGAPILDADTGQAVGVVTSGGFGPSLEGPCAMGYVPAAMAKPGTPLAMEVRGRRIEGAVVPLPFVPNRYYRG
jgi:aminomethyltransferase